MLDTRAAYNAPYDDEEVALYQRSRGKGPVLGRALGPRIAKVYLYPHELPTQDYFWGGYVSLIVQRDEVVFDPTEEAADNRDEVDRIGGSRSAPQRRGSQKPMSLRSK